MPDRVLRLWPWDMRGSIGDSGEISVIFVGSAMPGDNGLLLHFTHFLRSY